MRFSLLTNIILLTIFSCSSKSEKNIAAFVDSKPILIQDLDNTISNQLYHRLYDIYYSRKIGLDLLVTNELLKREAVYEGITVDSLLKLKVFTRISDEAISRLIQENDLQGGLPNGRGGFIALNSNEGKKYLNDLLFRKIKTALVDSLKQKYKIDILLKPPVAPKIAIDNILLHPLNEGAERIKVVIASDFECSSCQQNYSTLKKLISIYDKKVKFYFTPLSDSVNTSLIFSECLSNRIEFNKIYEVVSENTIDGKINYDHILDYLKISKADISLCLEDIDVLTRINSSIQILKSNQIIYTPTLIINNRPYYGDFDLKSISDYIDNIPN